MLKLVWKQIAVVFVRDFAGLSLKNYGSHVFIANVALLATVGMAKHIFQDLTNKNLH